jgi:hypothetical protein
MTKRFWGALNRAAISAVHSPGTAFRAGKHISLVCDETFLKMHLPSGREIAYAFPKLITAPGWDGEGEYAVSFKHVDIHHHWVDFKEGRGAWLGTWVENAVQAVSRDLLAAAMIRLEAAGYKIVLTVHDEIVAEVPEGFGGVEEFRDIITEIPTWASGLPLAAKGREGPRFAETGASHGPRRPADNTFKSAEHIKDYTSMRNHPNGDARDNYASGEERTGSITDTYIYRDIKGENYLRVERTTTKQFWQSHWENGNGWVYGNPPATKIPYRLPELLAAPDDEPVFVCAGEKDANNVAAQGYVATTNPGGEGSGQWTLSLNPWFMSKKKVFVLEDNDAAGRAHVLEVAGNLRSVKVPEVKIVKLPDLPDGGDVSDYLATHTKEELLRDAEAGRSARIIGFNPADWATDPTPEPLKEALLVVPTLK